MDVTQTAAVPNVTAQAQSASGDSRAISSDFETFLKMLTVQLQNQDPLSPLKSEDFAVQLATFSGVEQQVQTNTLLQSLGAQMNVMGMSQLAGWVGMEARASVAANYQGNPVTLTPQPAFTADAAYLVAHDAQGAEVLRTAIPVSDAPLQWTGLGTDGQPLSYGLYGFSVESFSNGALADTKPVEVYTRIIEARTVNGQTILITDGGAEVAAAAVTGLRDPAMP